MFASRNIKHVAVSLTLLSMLMTALLIISFTPTASGSSKPAPSGKITITQGYSDVLYDANGKVVSRTSANNIPAGQTITSPYGAAVTTGSDRAHATKMDGPDALLPANSGSLATDLSSQISPLAPAPGCMDHKQYVIEVDSITSGRLAIYGQKAHWCWDHAYHITVFHSPAFWEVYDWSIENTQNCYGTDSQSCFGWYYSWHTSTGGHYSYRKGHADTDCLPPFGCFSTITPYVELWVNAGPYYVGDGGGTNGGGGT